MDKLKMQTKNLADENYKKLAALFPNAVTETITGYDENGNAIIERAIDKDVLMQEINTHVVEGREERYQFTWPDKKKSVLLANAPINKTLRPCREESVGKDGTLGGFDSENLYIEGDNLEVLKLLQETYLGKIKMIYIDPPYNTGKDFLYKDNYAENINEYLKVSHQFDDDGNIMVQLTESDGRFHSKWLSDIYPRLRIAKNLLADDGIIFLSIDEKEYHNLRKLCDETFGEKNYVGDITWEATTQPTNAGNAKFGLQKKTEAIIIYAKKKTDFWGFTLEKIEGSLQYPHIGKYGKCRFEIIEKSDAGDYSRPSMKFKILGQNPREGKRWQIGEETARELEKQGKVEIVDDIVKKAVYPEDEIEKQQFKPFWSLFTSDMVGTAQSGKDELNKIMGQSVGFDTVKPTALICKLLSYMGRNFTVLDFFSGSATTAQSVFELNNKLNRNVKFILVQVPQKCADDTEAKKAGYDTICEIGKERIRRAGKKIREELGAKEKEGTQTSLSDNSTLHSSNSTLDTGFRVLKCDSSNMKDVFYTPDEYQANMFDDLANNIKEDRTPEDLLFQVMLDMGVLLSSKIEEIIIAGKKVFKVADGFLMAFFDKNVNEETITEVAKQKPYYFVMRDSSLASDSVAANFEQIFKKYSPETERRIL